MKKLNTTLILLLMTMIVVSSFSCSSRDRRIRKNITSILTPISSGNPYEIMIVAEDSVYDGYVGKSILAVLETPMKGLPRDEAYFKVSHITPAHYDRITNLFRNIIRIVVNPKEYTMAKFKLERDVFSSPPPQAVRKANTRQIKTAAIILFFMLHSSFIFNDNPVQYL